MPGRPNPAGRIRRHARVVYDSRVDARPRRRQWLRRAALFLILGYAAFLRFDRITSTPPGLYRDEAMNGNNALKALETGHFAVFYPEDNGREGLYINVAAAFVARFGNQAWALRLPAAIFGVLTVGGVYLAGAEWFGGWTGLAAAFFLATSFWHVNFSRIGLRAIAAPCFLAWAVYLLAAGMRRGKWWAAAAGVVYGLGFYTYLAYRTTPLLMAAILWRATARVRWVFSLTAAGAAAPLAWYFAGHPGSFWGRAGQLWVGTSAHPAAELARNTWRTARMFFRHGDGNWRHNIAWRAELFWPVAALFAAGVVVAAVRARRGNYGLALAWLAAAGLPVVFSDEMLPHALRSLLMAPAVFLLAAVGVREVYTRLAEKLSRRAVNLATAMAALWLAWEPYHSYFEVWARNAKVPPAFDASAMELARRVPGTAGEKTVIVPEADPAAAWPVMFLTGSYTENQRREKGIRYVTRGGATELRLEGGGR